MRKIYVDREYEYMNFMDERSALSKRSISKVKSALYSFRFILGDDFKAAEISKDGFVIKGMRLFLSMRRLR